MCWRGATSIAITSTAGSTGVLAIIEYAVMGVSSVASSATFADPMLLVHPCRWCARPRVGCLRPGCLSYPLRSQAIQGGQVLQRRGLGLGEWRRDGRRRDEQCDKHLFARTLLAAARVAHAATHHPHRRPRPRHPLRHRPRHRRPRGHRCLHPARRRLLALAPPGSVSHLSLVPLVAAS